MGCDIHWFSETRKDGQWVCDQAHTRTVESEEDEAERIDVDNFPGRSRDYWMFGLLAEVRYDYPWSFSTKGMPADPSKEVAEMCAQWAGDGHSHSYLDRQELREKLAELKLKRAELLITPGGHAYSLATEHFVTRRTDLVDQLAAEVPDTDRRIVFWFDN